MAQIMSVQVKNCQLRSKPSFLGKIVTNLSYADQVNVQQERDNWYEVNAVGKKGSGWVHVSALSEKKIVLKADSKDIENAASSDELALAGKGFNEEVEQEYRSKNKNADFTWIDKMEKITVSQNEIQEFLQKGGLKAQGGDA